MERGSSPLDGENLCPQKRKDSPSDLKSNTRRIERTILNNADEYASVLQTNFICKHRRGQKE
jgi:hypothetical protein